MRAHNIPSCQRKSKRYPFLEHICMVPKVFESCNFGCIMQINWSNYFSNKVRPASAFYLFQFKRARRNDAVRRRGVSKMSF